MLVNFGNVSTDNFVEGSLSAAMILLIILVVLLAIDGIYHIVTRPRRRDKLTKLNKRISILETTDLRIYGKVDNPEGYSLVQMEVTVMVANDKINEVTDVMGTNVTIVNHHVLETYNAKDFQITGGMQNDVHAKD